MPPDREALRDLPPVMAVHNRHRALDGYRFVAAMLVLLYHYNMDFQLGLERLIPTIDGLYAMVDFFFVLSGFIIAIAYADRIKSRADYLTFLRRRFARLYPLHALMLIAYLGLAALAAAGVVAANHPELLSLSNLPANATLTHAWGFLPNASFNVPSWSISAEWFLYLLFPALAFAARRLSILWSLALIAIFITAMDYLRGEAGLGAWTGATYDVGMLRALPTFYAGVLIARWSPQIPKAIAVPWPVVHLLFLAGLVCLAFPLARGAALLFLALTVAAAVLADRQPRASLLASPMMTRLGDASYGVYMIHVFASIPVLFVLRKTVGLGGPAAAAAALLTALAVIVAALWLHRFFETPMRLWIAGESRRLRPAPAL